MKWLQRFNVGNWTLLGSLLILASLIFLEPRLLNYQLQINAAKQAFVDSQFASQTQLVELVQEFSRDGLLAQNINWNLNHSIEKSLEAALRPGELDELYLFENGCQLLAKATYRAHGVLPCDDARPQARPALFSTSAKAIPGLAISYPITGATDRTITLVGVVNFDDNWFRSQPKLRPLMKPLLLSLVPLSHSQTPKGSLVVDKNSSGDGVALVSNLFLAKRLALLLHQPPLVIPSLWTWFFLLIFISTFTFYAFNFIRDSKTTHKQLTKFYEALGNVLAMPLKPADNSRGTNAELMAACKDLVNGYVEQLKSKAHDQAVELKKLNHQILQQELELKNRAREIESFLDFKTLGIQLRIGGKNFLKEIDQAINTAEDVSDVLVHGLNRDMQTFYSQIQNWQNGIEQRGLRRFLRGLAENNNGEQNKTAFEMELESFVSYSSNLATISVNLSLKMQELLTALRNLNRIVDHWQKLTQNETVSASPHYSILNTILSAQNFFTSNIDAHQFRFTNMFAFSESESNPPCPQKTLQSAIAHIYITLKNQLPKQGNSMTVPLKSYIALNRDRTSLVINAQAVGTFVNVDFHKLLRDENFVLAQALLQRHGLTCELLPKVGDDINIAINWEKSPASDKSKRLTATTTKSTM